MAALRVKDAVVKRDAALVVVSPRWGELVPFARAWLRPRPGREAAVVQALAEAAAGELDAAGAAARLPELDAEQLARAVEAVRADADASTSNADGEAPGPFAVLFAPTAVSVLGATRQAGEQARACANLAITARGAEAAASLHYLPTEANVLGAADMGIAARRGRARLQRHGRGDRARRDPRAARPRGEPAALRRGGGAGCARRSAASTR